jgi:hypothetical protein
MIMVSGVSVQVSAFWPLASRFWLLASGLTPYMKLRLAGTVNRLNVEH